MARNIHLRLTGQAEKLVVALTQQGLNERDIFSKSLWLLSKAVTTNRVAMLKANWEEAEEGIVEYVFSLGTPLSNANEEGGYSPREGRLPQVKSATVQEARSRSVGDVALPEDDPLNS